MKPQLKYPSIHTFELGVYLPQAQHAKVKANLNEAVKHGKYEYIRTNKYQKQYYKLCSGGMQLYMNLPRRPGNEGALQLPIVLRHINPGTLLGSTSRLATMSFSHSDLERLECIIKSLLSELGLSFDFSQWSVWRLDMAQDFVLAEPELLIKALRQVPCPKAQFCYKGKHDHGQLSGIYWRSACAGESKAKGCPNFNFNIYIKEKQMRQKYMANPERYPVSKEDWHAAKNLVRYELQLVKRKSVRTFEKFAMIDRSDCTTLTDYFESIYPFIAQYLAKKADKYFGRYPFFTDDTVHECIERLYSTKQIKRKKYTAMLACLHAVAVRKEAQWRANNPDDWETVSALLKQMEINPYLLCSEKVSKRQRPHISTDAGYPPLSAYVCRCDENKTISNSKIK